MEERTDINKLGEFGLIDRLTAPFHLQQASSVKGVGDDAAVVDNGNYLTLVSTDMLVEGIHFDMMYTPLRHLGYKSIVVNLSDIYAMNGQPGQVTVSMAVSNRYSIEALDELYKGMREACEYYNVDLIGGDTTSSLKGLILSVTAIGQGIRDKVVYRNGARPGDLVCISGNLGAAYLGLQLLEREKQIFIENPGLQPQFDNKQYLISRLLRPEARRDIITMLADANIVPTAMIDISDGLASECYHICKQSEVGILIEESGVSIHPDAQMMALQFGLDPITCALSGGEDYELLFTIRPEDFDAIRNMPDIYIAGEIMPASYGLKLRSKGGKIHDLQAQGWSHF